MKTWLKAVVIILTLVVIGYLIPGLKIPLQGVHEWRQADTLYSSYFYCSENADFFKPKIGPRMDSEGIAIGELPVFSYLLSLKCKATGTWDEVTPKLLTYLTLILLIFSWGSYFKKKFTLQDTWNSWLWVALFFFTPSALRYLTIPIPDGFALLLYSLCAHAWLRKTKPWQIGGAIMFFIAFMIRPYFFPLLFLITDVYWIWGLSLFLAACGYGFWFKYWVYQSSLQQYYGTELRSPALLLKQIPEAFPELIWQFFRDHWNFLGALFFWKGIKGNKRVFWVWVMSWAIIIGIRGSHFMIHSYYLLGACLLSAFLMYQGYWKTSAKYRDYMLVIMMVLGIAAVQHLWYTERTQFRSEIREQSLSLTKPNELVAAYTDYSPAWLYYTLRAGWILEPNLYEGPKSCPKGVSYALIEDSKNKFQMIKCEQE